ncbi:hypothetical protein QWU01_17640 [Kluyvera cryocrescens]|uniref:Uncharacterized protein n=1 Tax=Kluyvera cryocrescens TaxID=580 RepID=A0AAW9CAZ0_KLUCR|nr:hypothetical protein [Kluyvera cryocrescens]HDG1671835.1 hypothetical protein [Kluyvera cryocrescens]
MQNKTPLVGVYFYPDLYCQQFHSPLCLILVNQHGYGAIKKKRYNPAIFFVADPFKGERE